MNLHISENRQRAIEALRKANPFRWTSHTVVDDLGGTVYACGYGVLAIESGKDPYLHNLRQLMNETFDIPTKLAARFEQISDSYGYKAAADFLEDPENWKAGKYHLRKFDHHPYTGGHVSHRLLWVYQLWQD